MIKNLKYIQSIVQDKDSYKNYVLENELEIEYNKKNTKEILNSFENKFKELGITHIRGTFEGGHDEGGFDRVDFVKDIKVIKPDKMINSWVKQYKLYCFESAIIKDGTENHYYYTEETKTIDLTEEYALEKLLQNAGCLERYGTFAFEGHVNGEILLDVYTGKWKMKSNESYENYEEYEEEGEAA